MLSRTRSCRMTCVRRSCRQFEEDVHSPADGRVVDDARRPPLDTPQVLQLGPRSAMSPRAPETILHFQCILAAGVAADQTSPYVAAMHVSSVTALRQPAEPPVRSAHLNRWIG